MTNSEKINQWLVECVEQSDAFFFAVFHLEEAVCEKRAMMAVLETVK